jgi:hypothetical protein
MATNSGWHNLLTRNRYLVMKGIVVSITQQWRPTY